MQPAPQVKRPLPEVSLWTLVRTGGSDRPKKVPRDRVERLYRQDTGVFAPRTWPASIPLSQPVTDDDKTLKDLQAQWGMTALVLSHGIVHLESAVLEAVHQADADPLSASVALLSLNDEINKRVAVPLAHALRLAGGYFNELSAKRHKRIAKGVRHQQLEKWLEAAPETTTLLFPEDVGSAMEASWA